MQSVAPRSLAHRGWIKPCRLDQDIFRLLRNHGVESAHDSGQRDRLHGVGDDQIFRGKFALDAVQRFQCFAAERPPHQNLSAFEQIEIEDVGGMSHLPQRVIGRVGGIVDGALIDQQQPLGDRVGRRFDVYIANDPRRITGAAGGIGDFDGEPRVAFGAAGSFESTARSGRL